MGLIIFLWVLIGLVVAFDSAAMAIVRRKFHPMVDLVCMPILFVVLGPIPVLAKLLNRLNL
jgi:hypothetical protein